MAVHQDEVIYRRDIFPKWPSRVCWAALLALAVVMPIVQPAESDVPFVVDALGYAIAWGIPLWIALLTLWSLRRYSRVTVTRSELRVGRERIPVGRLDRDYVYLLATEIPALAGRLPDLPDLPWDRLRGHRRARPARLLGGAYAAPIGARSYPLMLTDGTAVAVATRDPAGLVEALLAVVPPH
jgi:hypothetical protein